MRMYFRCRTNKEYCMINKAIFHLDSGGTISIDRMDTEYSIENGVLNMVWDNCYIWEIDGYNIFGNPVLLDDCTEIPILLEGTKVELELEDDADEDYFVDSVVFWL